MAVPGAERLVVQKEAAKKPKCNSLCIETQGMRNMNWLVIPVIIVVTGIIAEGIKKKFEKLYQENFQ